MKPAVTSPPALARDIPATFEAIDAFCGALRKWLSSRSLSNLEFKVELVVREGLINAVAHGSKQAPGAFVHCSVRIGRKWMHIEITDQGPGFDWRAEFSTPGNDNGCSGRGLQIFREYTDKVVYNPAGNRVLLLVPLPQV